MKPITEISLIAGHHHQRGAQECWLTKSLIQDLLHQMLRKGKILIQTRPFLGQVEGLIHTQRKNPHINQEVDLFHQEKQAKTGMTKVPLFIFTLRRNDALSSSLSLRAPKCGVEGPTCFPPTNYCRCSVLFMPPDSNYSIQICSFYSLSLFVVLLH